MWIDGAGGKALSHRGPGRFRAAGREGLGSAKVSACPHHNGLHITDWIYSGQFLRRSCCFISCFTLFYSPSPAHYSSPLLPYFFTSTTPSLSRPPHPDCILKILPLHIKNTALSSVENSQKNASACLHLGSGPPWFRQLSTPASYVACFTC